VWYSLILIVVTLFLSAATQSALAGPKGKKPSKPPQAQSSFTDHLEGYDISRWSKADGWANGSPFDNAWSADHVAFTSGDMHLQLDDTPQLGEPYTSGEYRTQGFYGYGCYEASMKPAKGAGVVTSLFTYAGPWDNGGNGRHNEIDIEFPGRTDGVQFNFWTNDDDYTSTNEYFYPLTFDASAEYHRYGFKWTASGIAWFVDGNLAYEVFDTSLEPTPKAEESLQKIMMNLWVVDQTAELWAGTFVYPGNPLRASYQWVRHIAGEACDLGAPPQEPEPPAPATGLHIGAVNVSLNTRATQAIAQVTVLDAAGVPASGVSVTGDWSGLVSGGDSLRETDANGVATFYSSRFRSSGELTFCVTELQRAGSTYDPGENLATCDTVVKE
jgi:beta-glucanase (GH16 family)